MNTRHSKIYPHIVVFLVLAQTVVSEGSAQEVDNNDKQLWSLTRQLNAKKLIIRDQAKHAIIEAGIPAVDIVLKTLLDKESPRETQIRCISILRSWENDGEPQMRARLKESFMKINPSNYAHLQFSLAEIKKLCIREVNSIGMKFALVPAGTFEMGSMTAEEKRGDDEHQHEVRISKSFYLGIHEVTQKEWTVVMGTQPWLNREKTSIVRYGDDYPASWVSWNDAQEFIRKLNEREKDTSRHYRLPTEAEWEFACRAGSNATYSFGGSIRKLGEYAWFGENALIRVVLLGESFNANVAQQVGQKKPNALGLFDMYGNLWEWCADWYEKDYYENSPRLDPKGPKTGSYRVLRGGSYDRLYDASDCRSANRSWDSPASQSRVSGFRLVCELR